MQLGYTRTARCGASATCTMVVCTPCLGHSRLACAWRATLRRRVGPGGWQRHGCGAPHLARQRAYGLRAGGPDLVSLADGVSDATAEDQTREGTPRDPLAGVAPSAAVTGAPSDPPSPGVAPAESGLVAAQPTRPERADVPVGAALAAWGVLVSLVVYLSPPDEEAFRALGSACGALALCGGAAAALLAAAKLLLGDQFHVEVHRGRLYVQWGCPSSGPPLQDGSVEVRPTGDVRGNGAFAVRAIKRGTHVCDYTGEVLSNDQFFQRYLDGKGDYAMGLDADSVMDARHLAPITHSFAAVHMNHARNPRKINVCRYCCRSEQRVAFFALRDIAPGEELCYDYGRNYWRGREHLEIP